MTTLEQLQQLMDDYGNTRYLVEDIKSSQETILKTILSKYPDAQKEIEDMEEELGKRLKDAEELEKKKKKILQAYINEYIATLPIKNKSEIKSNLIRVGVEREIWYDPDALDGMAVENSKLLAFRNEKLSTRITLNRK